MLPTTTTTTTTLFLPDSRARMRDRVQENKEKEQNRRSEKQSILKTFKHDVAFSFFPPVVWHWCCAFAWLCAACDDKAQVVLGFFFSFASVCVRSRVKKQTMQCRCHKQKGKEKERTRSASYDHWSIKHSISEHNAHISCKEASRGRSTSYARTETQQYKRMTSVFVTLFLSRWLS